MSLKHSHAMPANLRVPLNMATGCEEMMGEHLDNNSGTANEPCAIKSVPMSLLNSLPAHLTLIFFFFLSDFLLPCEIFESRKYVFSIFTDPAPCKIPGTQLLSAY